jgi:hypothetical protein
MAYFLHKKFLVSKYFIYIEIIKAKNNANKKYPPLNITHKYKLCVDNSVP